MNDLSAALSAPLREKRDWLLAACVFAFSLAVCRLASGGDVLGDEAFYLYLSRTFGLEPAAAVDHAWFHVLNRPLYYAVYHFGTYGGFVSFRWFSGVLCASVITLAFTLARALGASQLTALCAAVILALERSLFVYAAHGFPDVLASGVALLAIWAAAQQRAAATALLACACVLCKESFVAVPFIAAWLRVSAPSPDAASSAVRQRVWHAWARVDAWAWLTVLLPTSYVIAITLLGATTPGVRLQGWSQTALSFTHARGMWVGPELWPLIVWLISCSQWRRLGLWLGMPLFYALWSWGLGRGLSPWYVIGPATLSAVVAPSAIDACVSAVGERWGGVRAHRLQLLLLLSLVPIAYSGVMRLAPELRRLPQQGLPKVQVAPDVVAIMTQLQPERVLLVNCFWSYRYTHLRGPHQPATSMEWPPDAELARVVEAARAAQVTIMCRTPETRARGIEQRLAASGFETLLVREDYWVVRGPE